jgi:predicted GNAT family acetyltransferase
MTGRGDEAGGGDVAVVDAPARHRFEAVVGDQVAILDYRRSGDDLVLVHTEVPPALRGRGLGEALARFALEFARTHGLAVVPRCPFVADYLRAHPEYAPLVRPRD